MKTITLRGDMNCGKSTTIRMVYDSLKANSATIEPIVEWGDSEVKDFSVFVDYCGLRVAIYSMGDLSRHIVNAIREYRSKGADIFICSCRAYMVNPYKEMANDGCEIIDKSIATEPHLQAEANKSDAAQITALLR